MRIQALVAIRNVDVVSPGNHDLSIHSLLLSQRMKVVKAVLSFLIEEKQIVSNHEAHAKTCVLYQTVYGTCDSNWYNEPNSETE